MHEDELTKLEQLKMDESYNNNRSNLTTLKTVTKSNRSNGLLLKYRGNVIAGKLYWGNAVIIV